MLELEPTKAGLLIREDHHAYEMELPLDHALTVLRAGAGVIYLAPESPGRARGVEILEAGGEEALALAAAVLKRVLS